MERADSITKKIGSIYFSLLSPNEIRKMSGTKVITADTYDDDGFQLPWDLWTREWALSNLDCDVKHAAKESVKTGALDILAI